MLDKQYHMNDRQPKHQQFRYPSGRGRSPTHFANTPPRQFKGPLPLPPTYDQQQDSLTQWGQQFAQQDEQRKQQQWPPLPQNHAHLQSPLPHPQPTGHSKRRLWLQLGMVALFVLFTSIGIGSLASRINTTPNASKSIQTRQSLQRTVIQPVSQPTAKPTQAHALNWTITYTFKGTKEEKTNTFTVGDTWKITWTCDPNTIFGGFGVIVVNIFTASGTFQRGAINDTCKVGHTTGNSIEKQGGNIYLDITGGGTWIVQVQELK